MPTACEGHLTIEEPARLHRRLAEMRASLAAHHRETPMHEIHGAPGSTGRSEKAGSAS